MIRQSAAQIRGLLHRFGMEERAVAAVEFALILPLLLVLYCGSLETSSLFIADRHINNVSATMGDLVSQWDPADGPITNATIAGYFASSQSLMYPLDNTALKQVVSCVQVNADGTTKVIWSKAYNGGTARTVDASYPLAASKMMNQVARGGYIIASETYYGYRPLMGQVLSNPYNLYSENLYVPRYGLLITAS